MPLVIVLSVLLLSISIVKAGELDLHGYGTIGVVHSVDSGADYIRDIGQPKGVSRGETSAKTDSRFGLQLDYSHDRDLSFTFQALSKYQADATYTPKIGWAFAKYTLAPGLDLRIGRTKLDFVFQADTTNIGFPALAVRPAISLYPLPLAPSDGFDIDYSLPISDGYFTSSLNIGWATKDDLSVAGSPFNVAGSPLFGTSINYETLDWSLKFSYGQLKPNKTPDPVLQLIDLLEPFSPELADSLVLKNRWLRYYSLGSTFTSGNWRGVVALGHFDSSTRIFPSYYAQFFKLGYRLNKWTPFFAVANNDAHESLVSVKSGTFVDSVAKTVQYSFQTDQTTYSVGARYDLTGNVALKMQYDLIENDPRKTSLVLNEEDGWDGNLQLYSVVLDYYF